MPLMPNFNGTRIVYRDEPWPAECKLQPRPESEMTPEEIRAELKLLMTFKEADLHLACCVNPACPAKR